jgi:hypothetical protein
MKSFTNSARILYGGCSDNGAITAMHRVLTHRLPRARPLHLCPSHAAPARTLAQAAVLLNAVYRCGATSEQARWTVLGQERVGSP